jgi:hypothetical protein
MLTRSSGGGNDSKDIEEAENLMGALTGNWVNQFLCDETFFSRHVRLVKKVTIKLISTGHHFFNFQVGSE